MDISKKIIPAGELAAWREEVRRSGRRLVVTNGVFDIMHRGHVSYLAEAASHGDMLLVLANDDASVRELKGPSRPIQNEEDRAWLLASLECVAAVSIFHGKSAVDALRTAAPDVYVKGGDYTPETLNREEFCALQACGSQIKILQLQEGRSTTNIVKKIQEQMVEIGDSTAELDKRLAVIFGRRSVRNFRSRPVEQKEIAALLEAAMAAPSARRGYPAEFIVIRERETLRKIAALLPNGAFLADAPLGIIICGDMSRACGGELSYMIQDCTACMENMLVGANAIGLASCWLGIHPRSERIEKLRELFKLPENIIPVAGAAIGEAMEKPTPRTNYRPEQVHLEQW
jgi:rfaE bifunctional protein nucleotidyltransferase chain/domain